MGGRSPWSNRQLKRMRHEHMKQQGLGPRHPGFRKHAFDDQGVPTDAEIQRACDE